MPEGVPAATEIKPVAVFKVTPALVVETCVKDTSLKLAGATPLTVSFCNTETTPVFPATIVSL